eukprot:294502-Alexandrium_andersonii.AAC.1
MRARRRRLWRRQPLRQTRRICTLRKRARGARLACGRENTARQRESALGSTTAASGVACYC